MDTRIDQTTAARNVKPGDIIQATHGDPYWEAVSEVNAEPLPLAPFSDAVEIVSERSDGTTSVRYWGVESLVRVIR